MRNPSEMIARPLAFTTGLLVLAVLVSGCKTTFRTVDERFMAHPSTHRRVQVLPIWFEGAGNIDRSLSTNDLQVLCRQSGKDLARALQRELQSKGYKIVGPVQVLHFSRMSPQPSPEMLPTLETVRMDLCDNLLSQFPVPADAQPLTFQTNTTLGFFRYFVTRNPARIEPNPFHYEMTPLLTNVLMRMGATNSDAVLLVDTKAFYESGHRQAKRAVWNWTGGVLIAATEVGVNLAVITVAAVAGSSGPPLTFNGPSGASGVFWVDPFWYSNNSLQHNIVLVDSYTREVLWLNQENFKRQDPSDTWVLGDTMEATLADLPQVR